MLGMDGGSSPENMPTSSTTETADADPPCLLCGKTGADKKCNGSGSYDLDVPVGHPDFSRVFRCPNNPQEADEERKSRLRGLSNLGAFHEMTFDNFTLSLPNLSAAALQSLEQAFKTAQRFAHSPQGGWIVFEGTYGCGKTHLAAAIANTRLEYGDAVLFITAPDLLDTLRATFGSGGDASYSDTFEQVRTVELLVLDDLGVENPSQWAKEKLFQLLNYRYTEKLATVITSNTHVDALDPRLRSRMLDENRVEYRRIAAPDYRSAKQNMQESLSDLHLYSDYRLETFDAHNGSPAQEARNLQRALVLAQDYVRGGVGWLVLMGESGTGKTHLAAGIAHLWQENGGEVLFVSAPNLLDYLRRTFNPASSVTFDEQFNQVKEAHLLVLDDLSAVDHSKAWVREKLVQIIKYRYVRRAPTVITTNQEIELLDAQIRTRLLDSRLCRIFAITARPYVDRMRSRF